MKITDLHSTTIEPAERVRRADEVGRGEGADKAQVRDSAHVRLSKEAQALSRAEADSAAKVARLRAAIEGGSFRVDAHAIADKLVKNGG